MLIFKNNKTSAKKSRISFAIWIISSLSLLILSIFFINIEDALSAHLWGNALFNTPINTFFSLAKAATPSIFSSNSSNNNSGNNSSATISTIAPLLWEEDWRSNFMIYWLTLDGSRTDTMMLVSYYWKENTIVTLNIPRDLYATYKWYSTKIVSLYAIAKWLKKDDKNYPAQFVNSFIEQEYKIPIQYYMVVDMHGFKQLIDTLGGINIHVNDSFTDYKYPTDNYNWYIRPAPHFDTWDFVMDWKTALIYARSRHSINNWEWTDFARSKRQQEVIGSVIAKMKENWILGNLVELNNYISIFNNNILTNLTLPEMISLAQIGKNLDLKTDYKRIDWNFNSGFICSSTSSDGQSILLYWIPNNCSWNAGTKSISVFRKKAISIVQNLLESANTITTQSGSLKKESVKKPIKKSTNKLVK